MHKTCLFSFSHEKRNEEHLLDTKGLRYENTAAVVRLEEIKPHFMHQSFFICLSHSFVCACQGGGGKGAGLDLIAKHSSRVCIYFCLIILCGANLKLK